MTRELNLCFVRGATFVKATPVNFPGVNNLKDRLEAAIEHGSTTQADVARTCGVSEAAVSKWRSGATRGLKAEHLFDVARLCRVDPEWLGTGRGRMLSSAPPTDPDRDLIEASREDDPTFASFLQDYRKLSSVEKTMVRTVVVSLARAHDPIYQAFEKDQRAINRKRDGKRTGTPAKSGP